MTPVTIDPPAASSPGMSTRWAGRAPGARPLPPPLSTRPRALARAAGTSWRAATAVTHLSETAERHPALVNLALAALGFSVFAALYWLAGHVGELPR